MKPGRPPALRAVPLARGTIGTPGSVGYCAPGKWDYGDTRECGGIVPLARGTMGTPGSVGVIVPLARGTIGTPGSVGYCPPGKGDSAQRRGSARFHVWVIVSLSGPLRASLHLATSDRFRVILFLNEKYGPGAH